MDKLLIALFPILGCFYRPSLKKYLLVATGISLFFLLAAWVTPYSYSILWLDDFLILLILSCAWGFSVSLTNKIESIYTFSALFAFVLGCILFIIAFADAFAGSKTILKHWRKDNYQVNSVVSSGFSGSGIYYYQLQKRAAFGLLITTLDRYESEGAQDSLCEVQLFDKIDRRMLRFDKCKEIIHLPD